MKENKEQKASLTEAQWSLYIIKTRLNTLYTGISTDVERRFKEHSGSSKRAARYLRGKGPLELVWSQSVGSKSEALILEYRVKKLKRRQKQGLIDGGIKLVDLHQQTDE